MNMISNGGQGDSLYHTVHKPRHPSEKLPPVVIFLHGMGADEHDLPGLLPYLDPRLFAVSVRAPFPFASGGGRTWYKILEVGKPEPAMFRESCERLERLLDEVVTHYPVNPEQVYLFGFSMGSIMSFAHALSHPESVRGVIANSGYIAEGTDLEYRWNGLRGLSFFVSHGVEDTVIPVAMARRARELLERNHADLTYREYPMGHQIGEEHLDDLSSWLTSRIDL
jgi:phospholipase/carboxylesterase